MSVKYIELDNTTLSARSYNSNWQAVGIYALAAMLAIVTLIVVGVIVSPAGITTRR